MSIAFMQKSERFSNRVDFRGNFKLALTQICGDYDIGEYKSHSIVPIGYEDLNLVVETEKGKFFSKIFASSRSSDDCKRYVDVVTAAVATGVSHPFIYNSSQGHLYEFRTENSSLRLCMMEYIDGATLYERGEKLTNEEEKYLIEQAAIINRMDIKPDFIYDIWAISNFPEEFEKKKDVLELEDREVITPLAEEFKSLSISDLPHAFVHGDIISSNVMKDKSGKLYIIDFSVSNWYPRIQELAVLLCDLYFDSSNPEAFKNKYNWAISEYRRYIKLTSKEFEALPLFAKAAHAMHVLGASYERSIGNTEGENNSWFELGRKGLQLSRSL
jgi:Ser/Thr protein kinase RdoA (MazF antagonist)